MGCRQRFSTENAITLCNSCALLIMGVVLVLPFNTFGTAKAYSVFKQIMSEENWAIIFISTGVIGAIGSYNNVNYYYRIFAHTVVASMLGLNALFFVIGNPTGIGYMLSVYSIQSYYMVGRAYKWDK